MKEAAEVLYLATRNSDSGGQKDVQELIRDTIAALTALQVRIFFKHPSVQLAIIPASRRH